MNSSLFTKIIHSALANNIVGRRFQTFQVVLKIIFSFSLILNVEFSVNLNSGNGIFSADMQGELS
jgi:hypothetical protein